MPNSLRGVFATANRRLSLPIAGIVFATISNKTGFTEWHASKGGWVCYAQDFLETWSGCDLIVGTSSGVPIKRRIAEEIGAATFVDKGTEKKIKQEKVKRAKLEESTEGTETKKRKTARSQKQLVISEEPERVSSLTVEKEVGNPSIPRSRVKTKIESSLSQVLVSFSTQGSLGSFDFVPQPPLGPFGHTCSRQKTIGDSVEREREREREREKGKASFLLLSLFYSSLLLLLQCLSLSLLTDEWLFLPCSLNTSQTPREARVSRLVMMWYDPIRAFCCLLPTFSSAVYLCIL